MQLTADPFEFIKTWRQLPIVPLGKPAPQFKADSALAVYRGCSAALYGNAAKAVVRFSVYNWALKFMSDGPAQTSSPQVVVAAMITGLFESLTVVPFENIKTTMIERTLPAGAMVSGRAPSSVDPAKSRAKTVDIASRPTLHGHGVVHSKVPNPSVVRPAGVRPAAPPAAAAAAGTLVHIDPSVRGFVANVRDMYETRGVRAYCQGFNVTVLRQIGNSAARFGVYNFLKQLVHPNDEPVSSVTAFALGIATGGIQAVVTQPIDVVKTRMQSANGIRVYGNLLVCVFRIFTHEGPLRLWAGLAPRFLKISFGGGATFLTYDAMSKFLALQSKENPFSWQ